MGTHGTGFVKRHSRIQTGRATHGGSYGAIDLSPHDSDYGEVIDYEQITNQDIAPGSVDGGQIQDHTVTADHFDTTAPAVPTGLTLSSFVAVNADGTTGVVLRVAWTDPADSDLHGVFIEVTNVQDEDGGGGAIWTNPEVFFVGAGVQSHDITSVIGNSSYFVRLRAVDVQGNRSTYTSEVSLTTALDVEAPPTPENPVAIAGFRGAIFKFSPVIVPDFAEYVMRYAPDDGTTTGPNTDAWTEIRTKTTSNWVTGLTPGVQYWFQAQSIDRSGNESAFTADDAASTTCTPTQVGASDIAANSISASHISTSGLSADVISTGILALGTVAGLADGLSVYDAAATTADKKVGQWDEGGIKIFASDDKTNFVLIDEASIVIYRNGSPRTAITPDGIDASAILFGRLSGGHNLLPNSSFEVGAFSTETTYASSTNTLDDQSRTSKTGSAVTIDGGSW